MSKKVNLSFGCDVKWDEMNPVGENVSHCSKCDINVVDYSNQEDFDASKAHCGRFDLSQVGSVKRNVLLSGIVGSSISLLSFLGISVIPQNLNAQDNDNTKEIDLSANLIEITGVVKDKNGARVNHSEFLIQELKRNKTVGSFKTNSSGEFHFKIDTINPLCIIK